MNNIIIHPGFAKTATTSLQAALERNDQILNIGRPYTETTRKLISNLIDKNFYDKIKILKYLDKIKYNHFTGTIILSDEILIGEIFKNKIIANRLKDLFQNAKILFTIRNQFTHIISYYSAHGRFSKNIPNQIEIGHVEFEKWFEYSINNFHTSYLGIIQYEPIIRQFSKLFGKESIKIILYEEIINEYDKFIRELCEFLKIDKFKFSKDFKQLNLNTSKTSREIKYINFRNKFLKNFSVEKNLFFGKKIKNYFYKYLKKGKKFSIDFDETKKEILKGFYQESNKKLARDFNLNLDKWDYP